jgi:hypothetical protein
MQSAIRNSLRAAAGVSTSPPSTIRFCSARAQTRVGSRENSARKDTKECWGPDPGEMRVMRLCARRRASSARALEQRSLLATSRRRRRAVTPNLSARLKTRDGPTTPVLPSLADNPPASPCSLVRDCQARYVHLHASRTLPPLNTNTDPIFFSSLSVFTLDVFTLMVAPSPLPPSPPTNGVPRSFSFYLQPLRRSRRSSSRASPAPRLAVTSRRLAVSSVSNGMHTKTDLSHR